MSDYIRSNNMIRAKDTGYIGHITGETDTHILVKWFYNPRNGMGIENKKFLKNEVEVV
jgi:hypothetical protein